MMNLTHARRAQRCRRHGQGNGQVVITFALTFALFLFGLILTVVDLSVLYSARAAALQSAQDAAVAGASNVDVPAFLSSGSANSAVQLLAPAAEQDCLNVAQKEDALTPYYSSGGPGPSCNSAGNNAGVTSSTSCTSANNWEIAADVQIQIQLPVPFPGVANPTVGSCYFAAAQSGTDTPAGN